MDGSLTFLLPIGSDLSPFNFEIPFFEWDGVKYPQGMAECSFGTNFKLQFADSKYFSYIEKHIPPHLRNMRWYFIEVLGNGPDLFISSLYGFREEEIGYTFQDLIQILLQKKEKWMLVFSHQYDGFTKVIKSTKEEIIGRIEYALKISGEGFMLHS
jgi:hypothetical protein